VAGGDHDLKPRRSGTTTHEDNLAAAADAIAAFVRSLAPERGRN
jgi:predicted alpha/beta-hydrolase family hydrolase